MFLGVNEARTIAQGEQQNRIAKFRAAVQNRQADRVRQEASAQAANIRRQRGREAAHLRARLASSGIDPSYGAALLSLETFSGDSELEALTAINQGEARAFGARANASELLAGGRAAQQKALLDAGTMAGQNFAKFYSAGTA
tara:strand:- start:763 stop:1188 length:426 start_codon:yes stop_codon:yes gene_type:complete